MVQVHSREVLLEVSSLIPQSSNPLPPAFTDAVRKFMTGRECRTSILGELKKAGQIEFQKP
jgi:hypothetical protein